MKYTAKVPGRSAAELKKRPAHADETREEHLRRLLREDDKTFYELTDARRSGHGRVEPVFGED